MTEPAETLPPTCSNAVVDRLPGSRATDSHLRECAERRADWRNAEDCICEELRACETRVMSQFVDGIELVSYRRGLDAARDTVGQVDDARGSHRSGSYRHGWMDAWDQCVAAIDALRGER